MTPGDSLPAFRRMGKMLLEAEYIVSSVPRMFSCRASWALLMDWIRPSISSVWNSMARRTEQ